MSTTLSTWAGKSEFDYEGSVAMGTEVWYGRKPYRAVVSRQDYVALLNHFKRATADIGTSFDDPPEGSVGAWLQEHVTKTATASYVGAILVHEGYAERVPGKSSRIRFK